MCNCCISRRELLGAAAMVGAAATAGLGLAESAAAAPPAPFDPQRPLDAGGKSLRVLPVFMHVTFTKRD